MVRNQWQVGCGWGQQCCPCKVGTHEAPEAFRTPSSYDEQGRGCFVLITHLYEQSTCQVTSNEPEVAGVRMTR